MGIRKNVLKNKRIKYYIVPKIPRGRVKDMREQLKPIDHLFLGFLIDQAELHDNNDFYKTISMTQELTGFTRDQQDRCIKRLEALNLLTTTIANDQGECSMSDIKDARRWFSLHEDVIMKLYEED